MWIQGTTYYTGVKIGQIILRHDQERRQVGDAAFCQITLVIIIGSSDLAQW